jgi:predicted GIY-YIG superfamily endonuclease
MKNMIGYERVYLLALEKYKFYVGSTSREMHVRYKEHCDGSGSRWTFNNPPLRCICWMRVPNGTSGRIENELTKYMMSIRGWGNVRGGDWVFVRCKSRHWLPAELRSLGSTDILELHARRVSHLLPETRRIIKFLQMTSGFHDPEHLNSDSFPEVLFSSVSEHLHHVDATHSVPVPLCAQ